MAFLVFDLDLAPPAKMKAPAIKGGGLDAGRTLSGVSNTLDLTGGGLVTVSYQEIGLGNVDPSAQRYWSRLAGMLNSGTRSIIVPLLNDFTVPGGFSAVLAQAEAQSAGTVVLALSGIRPTDAPLSGGEWFGVYGPNRFARAHVITDIDTAQVNGDGTASYTVGIAPPLREAYPAGTVANFVRPQCLMRLAPGSQISADIEGGWWTTPDVEFVESFGSL